MAAEGSQTVTSPCHGHIADRRTVAKSIALTTDDGHGAVHDCIRLTVPAHGACMTPEEACVLIAHLKPHADKVHPGVRPLDYLFDLDLAPQTAPDLPPGAGDGGPPTRPPLLRVTDGATRPSPD